MSKSSCKMLCYCIKHYYCHDDRILRNSNSYHSSRSKIDPSIKTQARRARDVPRYLAREHINDNIKIAENSKNIGQVILTERNRGTQPRRNRRVRVPKLKQLPLEESMWYKITMPYGNKYEKGYVINNPLNCIAPETFVPIRYNVHRHRANFYVYDNKIAVVLINCDRKITTTQGYKLIVRVTIPPFSQCEIDAEFKEKLNQAMAKRYVPATKAQDLSKFHGDPELISDYFCTLFQPRILKFLINVASQQQPGPHLEVLNLNGNKLDIVETLRILKLKLLKLKILHIGHNEIKEMKR